MRNRLSTVAVLGIALVMVAGCGQNAASPSIVDAAPDGTTDAGHDDASRETGTPGDASEELFPGDGPMEGAAEAGACILDASTTVCCCAGDIGATVVCEADGSIGCFSAGFPNVMFGVFYGADCTASCGGPCSDPCAPDSGPPDADKSDADDADAAHIDASGVDSGGVDASSNEAGSGDASTAD
jgi:hypothetical protein